MLLALVALPLWATPAAPPPAAQHAMMDTAGEALRVVLSLVLIIALILAAGWIGRRLQSRAGPSGKRIRCIESMMVGTKERIMLLEVGGQQLLVGVTPGGMRTLMVLDEPVPEPATDGSTPPTLGRSFADVLAQWRKKP
ncbi:flagellar biosynthetic protein FliO [Oleiagrimonas sp. C23AA]|nr:flagellar biosynthetic protein FliO [Oleiagrimonas sp. C23AA]